MEKVKMGSLTEITKQSLYRYIKEFDESKGDKLPNEDELGKLLGVSRVTIRSTLNDLASEGLIFRIQGKGTFINREALRMKAQFNPVQQFKDIIEKCDYKCTIKILKPKTILASKEVADALKLSTGEEVIEAKKIFYADQKVAAYCVDYFSSKILENNGVLDKLKDYENSIFEFISEGSERQVSWDCVEILTTTNLDTQDLKKYFNLENRIKSFLLLKGVNYDVKNDPLLYANEYIDTDIIRFSMIRSRLIKY
jgi:GntR family transcriptional regulator